MAEYQFRIGQAVGRGMDHTAKGRYTIVRLLPIAKANGRVGVANGRIRDDDYDGRSTLSFLKIMLRRFW